MACFIIPGKNLIVLFVLLYVVLLFCSHVSCVLTSVTRNQRDTFSYSGIWDGCSKFCIEKNAFFDRDLPSHGICTCQCSSDRRTFIIAGLKCMADRDIRNTSKWNRGQTFHMCQVFSFISVIVEICRFPCWLREPFYTRQFLLQTCDVR